MNHQASNPLLYCNSLTEYSRYKSRVVQIGDLALGGNHPIRIQSMTTTDTMNTLATVEQSIRMIESGCELVRITAPSIKEAQNLAEIKKELRNRGYKTPLIADIHFTPNAAELAARIVEKVRVNPGNYADKKKFENIDYSDATYESELERIRERFTPLVKICKEYGTAMRIGTNHGSLSDRIMSRYGDSPLGMVESALEFLRICESENYFNIVLSMKASNPKIMVQAYRLLIQKMQLENMSYPLHLGVTEAGEGEDGRIKSAVGIGTLLEDGIGDTVRVSLTEDPEFEAPVAIALVNRYANRETHAPIKGVEYSNWYYNPYEFEKRVCDEIESIGGHQIPRVIADFSRQEKISPANLFGVGYAYSVTLDKWNLSDMACDFIYVGAQTIDFEIPGTLGIICDHLTWHQLENKTQRYPLYKSEEFFAATTHSNELNFVLVHAADIFSDHADFISRLTQLDQKTVLIFDTDNLHGMAEQRRMFMELASKHCKLPVILKRNYTNLSEADLQLQASTDFGALFLDGFGDGVFISTTNCGSISNINRTAFGLLQATRSRISKTEYISCPSCGRTLFDLQETTARIRQRTDHLKGVKIGIMGCIVNGPGEMADADYGYVGVGVGKITLYKGKEVVKKSISSELAVDALIDLIKENGDWVEKEVLV